MIQTFGESKQVSEGLRKVLNAHGYNFQYAILRYAETLFSSGDLDWVFEAAEFPVIAGGETTHIDFILRSRSGGTYLVAECKRVDPARGNWCFARVPYTRRDPLGNELIFDQFRCQPVHLLTQEPFIHTINRHVYHLGLELKTDMKGNGISKSGSAINQAVTQVMRGASGLINYLFKLGNPSYKDVKIIKIMSAIFTTAQLWVTEADLGAAEITTGELPLEAVQAEHADWIWFNHNRSPSLRYDLEWRNIRDHLSKELEYEFTRSIAIISPKGIENFLKTKLEDLF